MNKVRIAVIIAAVLFCFGYCPNSSATAQTQVRLEVLNPRGEIIPPPVFAPAARIVDFSDKKIAIYWNGKAGGNNFWDNVETLLKAKLPGIAIVRYSGPYDLGDVLAARIADETDGFLYGVGD